MAITNSDGSIVLTTRIEDAGLKKGMAKIISDQKTQLQSLTREYAKLITNNKQNTEEAKKLKDQIDKLSRSIKENEGVLQSFEKTSTGAFSRVGSALKSIAGYLALAFSVTKIIQFSNEAGQLATQTEASVQRLVDIYGSASDSVGDFIDANARALGMSKAAAASFSSVYGNLFSVWADQATNAELTNRYLNMTAVVASKTGRTVEDVQERVRSGLLGNTEAIEDLGIFVNVKTIEMTEAFRRMADGKSWEQLDAYTQQQIRSMAILEQAISKYGDEVANTSATIRNRYKAAYEDFQNSWGNVINTVLLPVLQVLTQIFDIATRGLNIISGISGKILGNNSSQEEKTQKTAENIKHQIKNQKELNKEAKKGVATFDEINALSEQTSENTSEIQGTNVNLGGTSLDGSAYEQEINSTLMAIMGVVGISLAALGCILLFTGNIGWGLGFIIAGAGAFAVTVANLKDDSIAQETKDYLSNALIIAGIVAITIGVLLCVAQQWALGIGAIVVGASSVITTATLNWDGIKDKIAEMFLACWDWIKSYGMLILGIILCFSGAGLPYGVEMLVEWAKRDAKSGFSTSNAILDKVKETWNAVKSFWNKNIAPIFAEGFWLDLGKIAFNGLISAFEYALNSIIYGLRSLVNDAIKLLNTIGGAIGLDWDIPTISSIKLPRLAQGAVIPPNREFLAVLGDQKHGTNIEAPADLIRQMTKEGMLEASAMMNNNGFNGRIEVPVIIDGREIARAVRDAENSMGTQTVFGGFANVY